MEKRGRYLLDEDVLFEVLSRLTAADLVAFRRVCKLWDRLISDPLFAQAQLLRTNSIAGGPIKGFVVQNKCKFADADLKSAIFVSENGVLRSPFDFLPDDIMALASSGGLFCCRSCFPAENPRIFVCNPARSQFVEIPSCSGLDRHVRLALAVDPAIASFTLVRAREVIADENDDDDDDEIRGYMFEVYSSDTGEWRETKEICETNHRLSLERGTVYADGVVNFLTDTGDAIITFDIESELSWVLSVPEFNAAPGESCLSVSAPAGNGRLKLVYATVSTEGIAVWFLRDLYEAEWVMEWWVSLEDLETQNPGKLPNLRGKMAAAQDMDVPFAAPLGFHCGVLLLRVSVYIYQYCFDSGSVKEVTSAEEVGPGAMCYPTVLPYSPTLFPLR